MQMFEMSRLLFFAVLTVTVPTVTVNSCECGPRDPVLQLYRHGTSVTQDAASRVNESNIFPDDHGFLRRIAWVESKDGTDRNTYRANYHGGIWQVDEIGFADTQDTSSHPGLLAKYKKIQEKFGIDWPSVRWENLTRPLYSALAARLFLCNILDPIPKDLEGQAQYWKRFYNTPAGKGTVEKFIQDVRQIPQCPLDPVLQPNRNGTSVTQDAASKVAESNIFPNDHGFLRCIAWVESRDGTHPNTFREGYHGGIWQVDRIGFVDTQDTSSHPRLRAKYKKIKEEFGIDWPSVRWEDLRKPLYSALAARLFLSNIPNPIPEDLEGQARYWKEHYNTAAGEGTVEKFIRDVRQKPRPAAEK